MLLIDRYRVYRRMGGWHQVVQSNGDYVLIFLWLTAMLFRGRVLYFRRRLQGDGKEEERVILAVDAEVRTLMAANR